MKILQSLVRTMNFHSRILMMNPTNQKSQATQIKILDLINFKNVTSKSTIQNLVLVSHFITTIWSIITIKINILTPKKSDKWPLLLNLRRSKFILGFRLVSQYILYFQLFTRNINWLLIIFQSFITYFNWFYRNEESN